MIPYLANNSYIYGDRPEFQYKSTEIPKKDHKEETLIASIKNPIPCYKSNDDICQSEKSSITPRSSQQDRQVYSYSVQKPLQVHNSSHCSQSPNSRPLRSPDCPSASTRQYLNIENTENPQNSSFTVYRPESHYLTNNSDIYSNEKTHGYIQKEYFTPSHKIGIEQRMQPDRGYKENYCPDMAGVPSKVNYAPHGTYNEAGNHLKEDSVNSYSRHKEIPSYYIDKYLMDTDSKLSEYPVYRPKGTGSRCQEYSVLSESNITPCRSNNDFTTHVQPVRNGAFLDDIIEKYKDRIADKDEKSEKYSFNRETASRTSHYSYKEDSHAKRKNECNPGVIKPNRDVWLEQAKNTKEFLNDRPALDFNSIRKSSKSLLGKLKKTGSEKKVKKRVSVRSACNSKERKSCEREVFESMVLKLLKTHAKHCPALRKEIDSMQASKLLNL